MNLLHDAYTALLSGLTTKKPGTEEIWWMDPLNNTVTIEPLDMDKETYIVRKYYTMSGKLRYEYYFKGNDKHGACKDWHANGTLMIRCFYLNGKRHYFRFYDYESK